MQLGRVLVIVGFGIVILGFGLLAIARFNLPIGRLPGDIVWRGKNSVVYFPWVTCLVLSLLGTLLFWLFNRR
jgi:hypothetical protein